MQDIEIPQLTKDEFRVVREVVHEALDALMAIRFGVNRVGGNTRESPYYEFWERADMIIDPLRYVVATLEGNSAAIAALAREKVQRDRAEYKTRLDRQREEEE